MDRCDGQIAEEQLEAARADLQRLGMVMAEVAYKSLMRANLNISENELHEEWLHNVPGLAAFEKEMGESLADGNHGALFRYLDALRSDAEDLAAIDMLVAILIRGGLRAAAYG